MDAPKVRGKRLPNKGSFKKGMENPKRKAFMDRLSKLPAPVAALSQEEMRAQKARILPVNQRKK